MSRQTACPEERVVAAGQGQGPQRQCRRRRRPFDNLRAGSEQSRRTNADPCRCPIGNLITPDPDPGRLPPADYRLPFFQDEGPRRDA